MPEASKCRYDKVRDLIIALIEYDPDSLLRLEVDGQLYGLDQIKNEGQTGWSVVLVPEAR